MTAKWCFAVFEHQRGTGGFIPSVVTEDEPGHSPLIGRGELAEPWFWGRTFDEAERTCAEQNADLGIDETEAKRIVDSSIAESIRQDAAQQAARDRYDRIVGA